MHEDNRPVVVHWMKQRAIAPAGFSADPAWKTQR
jgi:hypothetical protein